MQTTIKTFDGVPYTVSLDRVDNGYRVMFTAQRLFATPQTITRLYELYDDAWKYYASIVHYYNYVRLEPVSEEQFLGLKKGTLYA